MPLNGDTSANADKLSGIEEESDIYEAFPPHVDTTQITVLSDSPTGKQKKKKFHDIFLFVSTILFFFSPIISRR